MTYSRASARKWCNDSEFALVTASFGGKEMAWTPALLRTKIERTRKLRDKNLDRFRQIRRGNRASTGAKVGKQVTAMAVAEKRAKLFDETLARFAGKLEKLNAARRPKPMKAVLASALAKKRAKAPIAGGRASPSLAAGAGKAPPAKRAPSAASLKRLRQMAGVRARNARNQARRDSRG
jgi:hypothetical protein